MNAYFLELDVPCQNKTECADTGADCVVKNVTKKGKEEKKFCDCGEGYVRNPNESECLKSNVFSRYLYEIHKLIQ